MGSCFKCKAQTSPAMCYKKEYNWWDCNNWFHKEGTAPRLTCWKCCEILATPLFSTLWEPISWAPYSVEVALKSAKFKTIIGSEFLLPHIFFQTDASWHVLVDIHCRLFAMPAVWHLDQTLPTDQWILWGLFTAKSCCRWISIPN